MYISVPDYISPHKQQKHNTKLPLLAFTLYQEEELYYNIKRKKVTVIILNVIGLQEEDILSINK